MARAIKWTFTAKTLENRDLTVNIYAEDYTGDAITVTPSADPMTWEDDDNSNLLEVYRPKTGYIRIIEENYGELTDIYPLTNTERYVEVLYNGEVYFIGYVQAQNFSNDYGPGPRVIELPVVSPLGVLDGLYFEPITQPTGMNVAYLLSLALAASSADYNRVYFPNTSPGLAAVIPSSVVSPLNKDNDITATGTSDVMDPISYSTFIEGICNAYGWMVHDVGRSLVFSQFDNTTADYCYYDIADLPTQSNKQTLAAGSDVVDFDDYFPTTIAGGKESVILPANSVEVEYEGETIGSTSLDLESGIQEVTSQEYYRYQSESSPILTNAVAEVLYRPVSYVLSGPTGAIKENFVIDSQGRALASNEGVNIIETFKYFKSRSGKFIVVNKTHGGIGGELFRVKLANHPYGYISKIEMTIRRVDNVFKDGTDSAVGDTVVNLALKIGNLYYHPREIAVGRRWQTIPYTESLTLSAGNTELEYFVYNMPRDEEPLEIIFYGSPTFGTLSYRLSCIDSINVFSFPREWLSSTENTPKTPDTFKEDNGSFASASVRKLFYNTRKGTNQLSPYTIVAKDYYTDYSYMLTVNRRIEVSCRASQFITVEQMVRFFLALIHLQTDGMSNWRIIGIDFDAIDDEYRIALQRTQ